MNIDQQFEELKNWADKNSILFVEGKFEGKKSAIAELPNNGQESIEIFKKVVEKLDVKVVLYTQLHFETETFNIFEKTVSNIEEPDIKEAFEGIRNFENKYFGYTLYFFSNGITYTIENYLDETNDFLNVQDAVYDFIKENNPVESKFKSLSQENITEFGRQLAENENYSKLKNRAQRENLARQLFTNQLDELRVNNFFSIRLVVSEAESYYEIEIKPKKEIEFKQKITEFIAKGWTKVKIASELGISKDTVNKYA